MTTPTRFAEQSTPSWPFLPTRDDVLFEWQYQKAMDSYREEWLTLYYCTGCEFEDGRTTHRPTCPEHERLGRFVKATP